MKTLEVMQEKRILNTSCGTETYGTDIVIKKIDSFKKLFHSFSILDATNILCSFYLGFPLAKKIRTKKLNLEFILKDLHNDAGIIFEVVGQNHYFRYYPMETLENTKVIMDIGAHRGVFSIWAAANAKNAMIYSYEPIEENFTDLEKNMSVNKLQNIIPNMVAVSDRSGRAKISCGKTNSGANTLYNLKYDTLQDVRETETVAFKEILSKFDRIDFLKIDAEGAEYVILLPLSKDELKKIRYIAMEYHCNVEGHDSEELLLFLQKNGFEVIKTGTNGTGYMYAKSVV